MKKIIFFALLLGMTISCEKQYRHIDYWSYYPTEHIIKMAEEDNTCAQRELGMRYRYGERIEKNEYQALFWLEKAARKGNIEARQELGEEEYYERYDRYEYELYKYFHNVDKDTRTEIESPTEDIFGISTGNESTIDDIFGISTDEKK